MALEVTSGNNKTNRSYVQHYLSKLSSLLHYPDWLSICSTYKIVICIDKDL